MTSARLVPLCLHCCTEGDGCCYAWYFDTWDFCCDRLTPFLVQGCRFRPVRYLLDQILRTQSLNPPRPLNHVDSRSSSQIHILPLVGHATQATPVSVRRPWSGTATSLKLYGTLHASKWEPVLLRPFPSPLLSLPRLRVSGNVH